VRKLALVLALLAAGLYAWHHLRIRLRPDAAPPDAAAIAHAANVTIYRDPHGVPHVYGKSDADTAFGFAYAHAEDDWPTIQLTLAAGRGRLGLLLLSKQALINDYYAAFVRVNEEVEAHYSELDPRLIAVLEAYARGLNFYAYHHQDEVDTRFLPILGRDLAGGFAHKLPFLIGVTEQLKVIAGDTPRSIGDPLSFGSNTHAVSSTRASDGVVRLNINSHQPWEGPVAWYEAHLVSEEGWNMTGGTFPGAPMILHGHNDHLGWAHTVNTPDLVDVYKLSMNPERPLEYRYDGAWRALEKSETELVIDTGLFDLSISRAVYKSVHGPVFEADHGFYAFRYGGMGKMIFAAEQWFKMNKASSFAEWKAAMSMTAIPMFNTGYADRAGNIYYVYNGIIPVRAEGHDYTKILPGDDSKLVFKEFLRFEDLPAVQNPASGFVQNCNATPYSTTAGQENPRPEKYSPTAGIEAHLNNRTLRSLDLLSGAGRLSREDFLTMKWDQKYSRKSPIYQKLIDPLLREYEPRDEFEQQGLAMLRGWDGMTTETSTIAALAILSFRPISRNAAMMVGEEGVLRDPREAYQKAVKFLREHHGKLDVPLGEVQRLRRGDVDQTIGGGPDIMNAVYTHEVDGKLVGFQGDSYVLIVEFSKDGVSSSSIHQYGNSSRKTSPHYADQAPLFVAHKLKKALRNREEIERSAERKYHPGDGMEP
jgi:acyl-homoserine-lactone acylase